tara:strand:- start:12 stop:473 length:462 start_codon:yes stop_codon:yes gene_type:complete
MSKNKYRVILNNKNLTGFFARTHSADDLEHKNNLRRNASRTTDRTYNFLNVIIYTFIVVDNRNENYGKEKFTFDVSFSTKAKELKFDDLIESSLPKKPQAKNKFFPSFGKATAVFTKSFPIKNGDNFFNITDNELINNWAKETWLPDYEVQSN